MNGIMVFIFGALIGSFVTVMSLALVGAEKEVDELEDTERGASGFGSTGK